MKRFMKIGIFALALCTLFGFSFNGNTKSAKAAIGAGDEKWSLIGDFVDYFNPVIPPNGRDPITYNRSEWNADFSFEYNKTTSQYELLYTFEEGDQFKIRKDGNYDVQIGYCGNTGGGIGDYLINEGEFENKDGYGVKYANFKVTVAGTYLLKIADNDVANYGDRSYGFSIEKVTAARFKRSDLEDLMQAGGFDFTTRYNVSSILITTDKNDLNVENAILKESCDIGENADQLTDDPYNIGCYSYLNEESGTYKLVIYANVDVIFANADSGWLFYGFDKLTEIVFKNFNTSRVVDMVSMFNDCASLESLDVSNFNTSNVKNMGSMFTRCNTLTNLDLSNFDTSNVTNMHSMFNSCLSLTALDLSNFDTSKVDDMHSMFNCCNVLKSLNVSSFDTSNVTDMGFMFQQCAALSSLDLSSFDASKVTDMENMFSDCEGLEEIKFSDKFTAENVGNMNNMFWGCNKLKSLDLSSFNPRKATTMCNLFYDCFALESIIFDNFDTSNVTYMNSMFGNCYALKNLDVSSFKTSKVTSMENMFVCCKSLESLDVSSFDTSNVESMGGMFSFCINLKEIKFFDKIENNTFVTSKVIDMNTMFMACSSLASLDVSQFDTSNAMYMTGMFALCPKLESLDLSNFNTSNAQRIDYMFLGCSSLKSLDLSSFDTSKAESMVAMFYNCSSLESLDISSFDFTNVLTELETINPAELDLALMETQDPGVVTTSGIGYMFDGANNLKSIKTPSAVREDLPITLPNQYTMVEGGVKVMDSTTTNMTLVPGSLELNKLYNDLCKADTCKDYTQASLLRDRYNALSDSDKALFATLSLIDQDKAGNDVNVLAADKLAYMEHMFALNSVTEKTEMHMMTSINDSSSFLVVALAMSSLAILGYYLLQKRKYAR